MAPAVQRNTSDVYDGPSPKQMIADHTFAQNIIERHMDACPIFDDRSILLLREFVQDPTSARSVLERYERLDTEGETFGTKATEAGDLAALIVVRHGTDEPYLTDSEVQSLKEWFGNGGGKTNAELGITA
ncbi:hypothetical protein TruAng_004377 [Truncatella angustata]|nr:hypothetical protein TruAng_004377 [Truncatella angustata]